MSNLDLYCTHRHGSRNPSNGDIKTFQELNQELDKEEHNIPNKDFYSWLIDWVQPYDILHAGQLRDVGTNDSGGGTQTLRWKPNTTAICS
jgi:hypothetical protein